MIDFDFFLFLIENWESFIILFFLFQAVLYLGIKKYALGGIFDPVHFIYTFTFGAKYAIIFFLYFNGLISNYLFLMIVIFGLIFYISFIYFSRKKQIYVNRLFKILVPKNNIRFEFIIIFTIFIFVSLYIISQIGFGLFAETNRFDNNKGYGAFVRITDVLGTFIIAYLSILFYSRYKSLNKNDFIQYFAYFCLILFICFFTILNGAKVWFLFGLMTVLLSIKASGNNFKISFLQGMVILLVSTFFAIIGLYINLINNNVDINVSGEYIEGVPLIIERFIHRIIANGNQSYMSLPNEIIDSLNTDNILIRLFTPIFGTGFMSDILNYNVGSFSVGRQILLYFSPNEIVEGGPTSHFDLFSYVYFGFYGVFFVCFLGYILGSINYLLRYSSNESIFYISLISTLWIRSLSIILEPPTGLAYIFDVIIIFFFLHVFIFVLSKRDRRSSLNA